jgi:glutamate mutase epsilon subunit
MRRAAGRQRRTASYAAASASIATVAALLTGCTSAASTLHDATGQGLAAVQTAALAVEQELDDLTFSTTATTTLGDARRELVDASTAASETDVTTASDADLREAVLTALDDGIQAVNDARDAMAGVGSLEATLPPLEQAADRLEDLESQAPTAGAEVGAG